MANLELGYCQERLSTCQRELNKHQTEKAALEGRSLHKLPPTGQSIADATAEIAALTSLVRHYRERVQAFDGVEDDDDIPIGVSSKRRVEDDDDIPIGVSSKRRVEDDDDIPIGRPSVASDWVLHTAREIMRNAGVPLVAVANSANQSIRLAFERHAPGSEQNYCVITKNTPNSVRVKFLVGPQGFALVPKETNVKFTFRNEKNILFTNEDSEKRKTYNVGLDLLLYREHLILVESAD